ncbi:MAG: tryptophan synthase subunit alpha, partial [Bacteroidales bacterium]|nr:tryptophan synthase subunit alpha [Bacteroidales bacterium]
MNRIDRLFQSGKKDILSVYFTAGYPKLDDTVKIIKSLSDHGVDMIEIGVPFSDPMADGPVIQASGQQALRNGMTQKLLFQQLKDIR